ncbi:MAG: hypothetical protein A3E78_13515 [Alphaproteobacteria bacterium RIFCSPHIGHO2_12_FULL_63_12]|nr:MAG: hypothetical protein A3E78_13515 [Alphaproteobacteria bacterium RIFCSPHIGHO2_12_FULL_63_12]
MAKKPAIGDTLKDEALKKLIRETVASAGALSPDDIPHTVKQRIREQAAGDLDVDAYIREAIKSRNKR